MVINEQIKEILKEFKINENDGILYLIGLHYNLNSTLFSDEFTAKICLTGIFHNDATGLNWRIPLFENQETQWDWVKTEYMALFKSVNTTRTGNNRDCIARFKKLFSKYPEIRKDDVIQATKLYLSESNPEFIRTSHYFIEKGVGASKSSDLLEWIDRYKEKSSSVRASNVSLNNVIQS